MENTKKFYSEINNIALSLGHECGIREFEEKQSSIYSLSSLNQQFDKEAEFCDCHYPCVHSWSYSRDRNGEYLHHVTGSGRVQILATESSNGRKIAISWHAGGFAARKSLYKTVDNTVLRIETTDEGETWFITKVEPYLLRGRWDRIRVLIGGNISSSVERLDDLSKSYLNLFPEMVDYIPTYAKLLMKSGQLYEPTTEEDKAKKEQYETAIATFDVRAFEEFDGHKDLVKSIVELWSYSEEEKKYIKRFRRIQKEESKHTSWISQEFMVNDPQFGLVYFTEYNGVWSSSRMVYQTKNKDGYNDGKIGHADQLTLLKHFSADVNKKIPVVMSGSKFNTMMAYASHYYYNSYSLDTARFLHDGMPGHGCRCGCEESKNEAIGRW